MTTPPLAGMAPNEKAALMMFILLFVFFFIINDSD